MLGSTRLRGTDAVSVCLTKQLHCLSSNSLPTFMFTYVGSTNVSHCQCFHHRCFQWSMVNCDLTILNRGIQKRKVLGFRLHSIPSSVMEPCTIPFSPTRGNASFPAHPGCLCHHLAQAWISAFMVLVCNHTLSYVIIVPSYKRRSAVNSDMPKRGCKVYIYVRR